MHAMYEAREHTVEAIAKTVGVSRQTVYHKLRERQPGEVGPTPLLLAEPRRAQPTQHAHHHQIQKPHSHGHDHARRAGGAGASRRTALSRVLARHRRVVVVHANLHRQQRVTVRKTLSTNHGDQQPAYGDQKVVEAAPNLRPWSSARHDPPITAEAPLTAKVHTLAVNGSGFTGAQLLPLRRLCRDPRIRHVPTASCAFLRSCAYAPCLDIRTR